MREIWRVVHPFVVQSDMIRLIKNNYSRSMSKLKEDYIFLWSAPLPRRQDCIPFVYGAWLMYEYFTFRSSGQRTIKPNLGRSDSHSCISHNKIFNHWTFDLKYRKLCRSSIEECGLQEKILLSISSHSAPPPNSSLDTLPVIREGREWFLHLNTLPWSI